MEPAVSFHFERDVAVGTGEILACLLDPTLLARSVPGAALTAADGRSVTGRIRIKQAAVPVVYALQADLSRAETDPGDQLGEAAVAVDGVAEEQRTGRRFEFHMRLVLTPSGPGRSRCRITTGLPAGDNTQVVLDRLMPQFVRRLEDVARELEENSREASPPNSQGPERRPGAARIPERWMNIGAAGAVAGVTAAAVLLTWRELRRRRGVAFLSLTDVRRRPEK